MSACRGNKTERGVGLGHPRDEVTLHLVAHERLAAGRPGPYLEAVESVWHHGNVRHGEVVGFVLTDVQVLRSGKITP